MWDVQCLDLGEYTLHYSFSSLSCRNVNGLWLLTVGNFDLVALKSAVIIVKLPGPPFFLLEVFGTCGCAAFLVTFQTCM